MNTRALKEGEKAARDGIFHLFVLGVLKAIAGYMTGMTVIIADAVSTFADTLGVFASYIGLKFSRKAADKHFEYGYYKIETFAALLISLGILFLGYVVFMQSIETFRNPQAGLFRNFAIATTLVAIFSSSRLAKRFLEAGKKSNSLSLLANARDKKLDVVVGFGVLISIAANYREIPYVEGVVSALIAIFIIKEGLASTKESVFFLLDYWNDPVLAKKIRRVLNREKKLVLRTKNLRLRRAGTYIFGEVFIELNPFAGVRDYREEIDILQEKVKELNPYIKDFSIFSHIPKMENMKIALPISSGRGLKSPIANNMTSTASYLFVTVRKHKITHHYARKITDSQKETVALGEFLSKEDVNVVIDNGLKSLTYYHLRQNHQIMIYPNFRDVKTAEKTVKLLLIDT